MSDARYFNVPIQLLKGFLTDTDKVLNDICDYGIYVGTFKLEALTELNKIKKSADFYTLSLKKPQNTLDNGKKLYKTLPVNSPKVGVSLSIWWDFYENNKSEFEKVCLLGLLAIKSILQQKPYCKIDNRFWFARMDGQPKSCEFSNLSVVLYKYTVPYQARKIKSELVNYWGLKTYSRYTRGFYVSLKLEFDELVYHAEKRRKSTLDKQKKEKERLAIIKALNRIEDESTTKS